jgi:hypothetical protein
MITNTSIAVHFKQPLPVFPSLPVHLFALLNLYLNLPHHQKRPHPLNDSHHKSYKHDGKRACVTIVMTSTFRVTVASVAFISL